MNDQEITTESYQFDNSIDNWEHESDEWQYEVAFLLSKIEKGDENHSELLQSVTDKLHNGHVMSNDDVVEFRKLLGNSADRLSDTALHENVDYLIAILADHALNARPVCRKTHLDKIQREFLPLSKSLLKSLESGGLERDYLINDGERLTPHDINHIQEHLNAFIPRLKKHVRWFKKQCEKPVRWDFGLECFLINLVSLMLEHLDPDYSPLRSLPGSENFIRLENVAAFIFQFFNWSDETPCFDDAIEEFFWNWNIQGRRMKRLAKHLLREEGVI